MFNLTQRLQSYAHTFVRIPVTTRRLVSLVTSSTLIALLYFHVDAVLVGVIIASMGTLSMVYFRLITTYKAVIMASVWYTILYSYIAFAVYYFI